MAPPPRTITTRPSSFTLSPPTAANPTPSAATTRTCSRRWGAVISHFFPFLCCSCFLHTSSLQLPTVCLVTSCILLCGIWNSAACSVNICLPATPTDQWSGLEMTQSLSPLTTDLLFFYESVFLLMTFLFPDDWCLSLSSFSVQSYIQSFRERQVQAQPFPSRLVGRPHTVVDVGYDCGSTTPLTGAAGPSLRVWPLPHLPEAWTHPLTRETHDSTITTPPGCNHTCARTNHCIFQCNDSGFKHDLGSREWKYVEGWIYPKCKICLTLYKVNSES